MFLSAKFYSLLLPYDILEVKLRGKGTGFVMFSFTQYHQIDYSHRVVANNMGIYLARYPVPGGAVAHTRRVNIDTRNSKNIIFKNDSCYALGVLD